MKTVARTAAELSYNPTVSQMALKMIEELADKGPQAWLREHPHPKKELIAACNVNLASTYAPVEVPSYWGHTLPISGGPNCTPFSQGWGGYQQALPV